MAPARGEVTGAAEDWNGTPAVQRRRLKVRFFFPGRFFVSFVRSCDWSGAAEGGRCQERKWDKSVIGSGSLSVEELWSCGGPRGGVWMYVSSVVFVVALWVLSWQCGRTHSRTHTLHNILVFDQLNNQFSGMGKTVVHFYQWKWSVTCINAAFVGCWTVWTYLQMLLLTSVLDGGCMEIRSPWCLLPPALLCVSSLRSSLCSSSHPTLPLLFSNLIYFCLFCRFSLKSHS